MHIYKLHLENFRGVKDIELTLDKNLNIFIGKNGAGKTTILDASSLLLSWLVNRISNSRATGRPIREDDIQNGKKFARLKLELTRGEEEYSWQYVKSRKGWAVKPILMLEDALFQLDQKYHFSKLEQASLLAQKIREEFQNKREEINIPLFVYYPVNRAVIDIPLKIRTRHEFHLFSAYDDSLTSAGNFRTFFEWFREREDIENEDNIPDTQLNAVRRAIECFMSGFTELRVRRKPKLRMEICKNGKVIIVNQLSDGEKCLLALIGDLARRLAIANPMRDNPLEGEGIVMIDELDLHLHPAWQNSVIPKIKETFPNLQFLISTHSPHIITHLKPENLFILELDEENHLQAKHPSESYGKTANRVLEDLMGLETTRPDEIKDAFKELYNHLDKGDLEQARHAIKDLKMLIGDDPDLIKADASLHYAEFRQNKK